MRTNVVLALADVVATKLGIILLSFLPLTFLKSSFLGGQQACGPVKLQLICGFEFLHAFLNRTQCVRYAIFVLFTSKKGINHIMSHLSLKEAISI